MSEEPKPCPTFGLLPDPLARLAVAHAEAAELAAIAADNLDDAHNKDDGGDERTKAIESALKEEMRCDREARARLDAYLAARSSPSAALREAELDRLAREMADASEAWASTCNTMRVGSDAYRECETTAQFEAAAEMNRGLRDATDKAKERMDAALAAALAAYRAAKERTGP